MKTIKDDHNFYLEKFRNSSLKCYGLFPRHYLSALALSWDLIISMTKVELERFSDAFTCNYSLRKI